MTYSIKGYSGALATLITAGVSIVSVKSFLSGTFTRAFTEYNLIDVALAVSMMMFAFAIVLLVKDIIDGGGWTAKEKSKALKGFGVGILLVVGAFYGASLTSQFAYQDPVANQFDTWLYAGGAGSSEETIVLSENYVTVTGGVGDHTSGYFVMNQTGFSESFMRTTRGLNLTISDDGITQVVLEYADATEGATTLLDSAVDTTKIVITDLGTTTSVSINWTLATVITWLGAHSYDEIGDYFKLKFIFSTDYDDSAAVTFTWNWIVSNDSDYVYYLVFFVMTIGFAFPFFILLDFTNTKRSTKPKNYYPRRKPSRSKRRRY